MGQSFKTEPSIDNGAVRGGFVSDGVRRGGDRGGCGNCTVSENLKNGSVWRTRLRICRVAGGRSWTDFANICVRGRHSYGRCVCLGASAVGPGVFLRCRSSWVESPRTCAAGEIVAIDGQTFGGRDVRAVRSLRWTKLHPWRPLFNLISHSHRNATDRDSAFPISDRHPQSTVGALSCRPSGR